MSRHYLSERNKNGEQEQTRGTEANNNEGEERTAQ